MGFRDEELAERTRVESLQRELESLREENAALRTRSPTLSRPETKAVSLALLVLTLALIAVAMSFLSGGSAPSSGDQLGIALVTVSAALVVLAIVLMVLSRLVILVPPNQLVVLSGRAFTRPDGSVRGFRVVREGRAVRVPIVERVDYVDLTPMELDAWVPAAYARTNVAVDLRVHARVEIARDAAVDRAVERFLGRSSREIAEVARQTIEGSLRAIAARLDVQEMRENSLRVAELLCEEAEKEFDALGLRLMALHILEVVPR